MTRRKWYKHDFLAESQKLLERAPTSKDAGLRRRDCRTLANSSGIISSYDGNPLNQSLVGVDWACVSNTLHMSRAGL
ncbi:hypothetical protein TNCT_200171 [Trichonephila clavata]|uniref:Uncharacterized protein n=1 Tax=Trichonephila clavata TaxID=2740835 RepID=A0A8X6HRS3_TRICU|nr:hypothetical protein TNCT_200171 [Trichonephila clavata]